MGATYLLYFVVTSRSDATATLPCVETQMIGITGNGCGV